ncbi:MAG: TIGR03936 family radical SAM-associated protein, partial [Oscillospiraceae bacterium]|nr:TIGR03936 family radical SAM-associated protein [Oscillospiraceae bacterium]
MRKCRLFFSKLGKIKYSSHLDLMRIFRRAFNRAELSVKHSEGFNPHPIMSIVLPLSTGQESLYEMLDVTFEEGIGSFLALPGRINEVISGGIRVQKAQIPMRKPGEIGLVKSRIEFSSKLNFSPFGRIEGDSSNSASDA